MRRILTAKIRAKFLTSMVRDTLPACMAAFVILGQAWSTPILVADEPRPSPEQVEFFESKIRPILAANCFKCHGADKQESDLRLDSRSGMMKGGTIGPAVDPGDPSQSPLIQAVRYDGDFQMPPTGRLSEVDIAALSRWVANGVPWPIDDRPSGDSLETAQKNHWAFQPVQRPPIPNASDSRWCRNPIDHFVHARLDQAGLTPSPGADRRTLIRRATYDLTGLPPTIEEVEAFVNDADPHAYEHLIDRLLESPHYGEQWARHWLDVARYSDTKGYVYAREEKSFVHSHVYRDWVVNAFNDDLSYDRFLLLQIAADHESPAVPADWAAMGFLTVGRRFLGNSHDVIDDRIDVLTRATMGLTVGCARCHDHKYDPIPTQDYYSLYGVFRNCTDYLVQIEQPIDKSPAYEKFEQELEKRQSALRNLMQDSRAAAADRARGRISDYLTAQLELEKYPEQTFYIILSPDDIVPEFVRTWQRYLAGKAEKNDAVFRAWRMFADLEADSFSSQAANVVDKLQALPPAVQNRLVTQAFRTPPTSIRDVADRYGALFKKVDEQWRKLVADANDKGGEAPTALLNPAAEQLRQVMYRADSPCIVPDEPIVSTERYFDEPVVVKLWKLQGEVDRWLVQSPEAPAHTLMLRDRKLVVDQFVFERGDPRRQGLLAPRRFLQVIAGNDRQTLDSGSGRHEIARAIADPTNPLTARVWVNRVWMHHFGQGLVRTPSDFGIRASVPSHPELLDWLASQFVADGWSTKKLHRMLMLSAAYRQRSDGPEEPVALRNAQRIDPENRLLWRMNARRLTFEEMRDTWLAAAGELDLTVGGKPVKIFDAGSSANRRTIYGFVDRQFVPSAMRTFDFANPDLHISQRAETTVPQQALFAMNDSFVARCARGLASQFASSSARNSPAAIDAMYRAVFQRGATQSERDVSLRFLSAAPDPDNLGPPPETRDWSYGYGPIDEKTGKIKSFTRLPHFTGNSWQGGPRWPDKELGWVQLTATGGHAGNDLEHAAIRRWTAPQDGIVHVESSVVHDVAGGDGIRCWIISNRHGVIQQSIVHNTTQRFDVDNLAVQAGDTLDFVVDYRANLNSDQFLWAPVVRVDAPVKSAEEDRTPKIWDAARDFVGPARILLAPWEQLAQVLLMSNELMFVD